MMLTMDLCTSQDVVRRSGITYRMLDYWCRTGVVTPVQEANGSGSRRGFTLEQAEHIRVMGQVHRYLSRYIGNYHVSTDTMQSLYEALDEGRTWLMGVRVDENGEVETGVSL